MDEKEKELFYEAVKAYEKHCEQAGGAMDYPSESLSTVGWKYVTLRNVNGVLCRYNHKTKTIQD